MESARFRVHLEIEFDIRAPFQGPECQIQFQDTPEIVFDMQSSCRAGYLPKKGGVAPHKPQAVEILCKGRKGNDPSGPP